MEPMEKDTRDFYTIGAGLAVAVGMVFLRIPPHLCIISGGLVWYGLRCLIPRKLSDQEIEYKPGTGVSVAYMNEIQAMGRDAVVHLSRLARRISKENVAQAVWDISDIVEQIFKNFEDDPADVTLAVSQTFLNINLSRAMRIVETYASLNGNTLDNGDAKTLAEAEEAITIIRSGFQEVLAQCRADNLRQLDHDSRVLTKMLEIKFPKLAEKIESKRDDS